MTSNLANASSSLFHFNSSTRSLKPPASTSLPVLRFASPFSLCSNSFPRLRVHAHSAPKQDDCNRQIHPIVHSFRDYARAAVLIAATASMVGGISRPRMAFAEQAQVLDEEQLTAQNQDNQSSPLSEFLDSNPEALESLKSLLQEKLENGEDEEALKILKRLLLVQPSVTEWKFLMARLLSEMGDNQGARKIFEEILAVSPLSFEALFENALLMDRCGEGEAVIKRLEDALTIAQEENKAKEARDVRLIMAQIQFLQKNVEEALKSYQELAKEDPNDFRPYFCQGMIYSLLDRNAEAREQFAKYKKLSPKKLEVDGYLRTPLSRMKIFGSDES